MTTPAAPITAFDPDSFMASRQPVATSPAFDPDAFMAARNSASDADPLRGAAQATAIGADTRGPFRRAWDEIKRGLASAQEGQGLKPQPTILANAAQGVGMIGDTLAKFAVAPEAATAAGAVENAIPSAQRAGQNFKELTGAIGDHAVHMTDRLANSLADIKDAVDTGSTLPSVINKFVTRITDLEEGPLTYKEARQFYSNISDLSASERMAAKTKDLRLIQEFKHALGETIGATADSVGRLAQYRNAMSEYGKAKQIEDAKEFVKDKALKAVIGGGATALGYEAIKKAMGQ